MEGEKKVAEQWQLLHRSELRGIIQSMSKVLGGCTVTSSPGHTV